MEGVLSIIGIFGLPAIIIWALSHYRYKTQKAHSELLTAMVNKGDTITPDIIASLGVQKKPKHYDLRRGVILIALAVAALITAQFAPDVDVTNSLRGLAM
ncbi:MAG: DUF6249 domain-containing protein, partial [Litorimonas sp.]